MKTTTALASLTALTLLACSQPPAPPSQAPAPEASAAERLDTVLAAQPDEAKARYAYRHPKETLELFGVVPGMTVVDTLPGEIWYAGILLDYLGRDGRVIGVSYQPKVWELIGPAPIAPKDPGNWPAEFVANAQAWRDADDAAIAGATLGEIPDDMAGTVDVMLAVRVLHQLMRFEDDGGYMTQALADMRKLLKPGGMVGVEQHRAPEAAADAWANGDAGYVKQSAVVAAFVAAGFELVEASEINANPLDRPTESDFVWRLPPTLAGSANNPERRAQMVAIGESDRMTLKFRKPAGAN
jgi:predicted methyltransferase